MLRLTLTQTPTQNLSLSLSLSLTPNQVRMLRGDRARGPAPASWGFSRRWAATSWHLRKPKRDGADLGVGSAYGVVHCPVFDCDKELALYNWRRAVVSAETMLAYDELVGGDETPLDAAGRAFAELRIKNERPGRYAKLRTAPARVWRFLNRTHILASNLLLENTRANRLLVWDWFAMAHARPQGFCMSHTEDQAALSLLVQNRSLPVLNPCVYLAHVHGYESCYTHTKRANNFLSLIAEGRYEVVAGHEYESVLDGHDIVREVLVPRDHSPSPGPSLVPR
eukprot:scaffold70303_cov64-Phaeocystis_antarctica.AAC.3